MKNLKLFNMVSLQKQFDVLTSSLNFFDMSYLISGGAMLCVLTYIPCGFRKMVFHANHIFLTAILCLLLSYVLGIISWVVGKHVRNVVLYSCESNLSNDQDFCFHFDEIVASFSWENVPISKLFAINKEAAFAHMWMMLDQSGKSCKGENKVCHEKPDEFDRAYACQNRFHYVNHLLVMRAIYEGMITPIVVFSVSFSFLEFPIWHSFWLPCQSLLSSFCAELVAAYLFEGSVLFVWCILVYGIMVWVVKLLACEARKTANTQIKEIVVAYHEFFV